MCCDGAGHGYSLFQRALTTGNMRVIEAAAAPHPKVGLDDALAILVVLAQTDDPRLIAPQRAGWGDC